MIYLDTKAFNCQIEYERHDTAFFDDKESNCAPISALSRRDVHVQNIR